MNTWNESLTFSRIPCVRCGSDRVLELACPDCGQPPRVGEVNSPVVGRREGVRSVEVELQAIEAAEIDVHAADAHAELLEYSDQFFPLLTDAVLRSPRRGESAGKFAYALTRLQRLIEELEPAAHHRPTAEARAYLRVARELERLWPKYREVVTTSDIRRVQVLANEGQAIIDGSTEVLDEMRLVHESINLLSDDETSLVKRVVDALGVRHAGMSYEELALEGGRRASCIVGSDVAPGPGLDFLTVELVAEAMLDPQVMEEKLRESAAQCVDENRMRQIASMEGAASDLSVARRDLLEAINHFQFAASQETRSSATLRRATKVVGEIYESSLPFLAWYRLLANHSEGSDRYRRYVQKDSTELVRDLAKRMPATFHDMPAFLRHSAQHGRALEVDEEAGVVKIQLRTDARVMPVDDYLDAALAMFESLLALNWALSDALERFRIDIPVAPEDADYMGLSQENLAAFWMETSMGRRVYESSVRDGAWYIEAELDEESVLLTALAIAQVSDSRIRSIEVAAPGASDASLEMNIADYQEFAATAEGGAVEDRLVEMLKLRHRAKRTPGCFLTEADVLHVVGVLSKSLLAGDVGQVGRLRSVRSLAAAHGFDSAAQIARSAIATLRGVDDRGVREEIVEKTEGLNAPDFPVGKRVRIELTERSIRE